MCKERYSGGRSIWNKGVGLGKECCCVDSLKVEARGPVLGGFLASCLEHVVR